MNQLNNKRSESLHKVSFSMGRMAILIGLLALIVRLIYIFEIRSCPFFDHPIIDAETYLTQAVEIAGGDILGKGAAFDNGRPYWQPPGYPFFLSIFIYIFGLKFFLLHFIGALIGAGTTVITVIIAWKIFGRRTAILSGLLMAFCGSTIFFDGELLVVGLYTFTLMILLFIVISSLDSIWRWFITGLVMGVAVVILPTVLIIFPLIAAWPAIKNGLSRRWIAVVSMLALGAILPVAPITARNLFVGKEPVLVSTNAGLNFFIGNHPNDSYDLQRIRPGREWVRLMSLPERKGIMSASGKERWFYRQSFDAIAQDPVGWIILKLRGVAIFFNGHEVMRNQDPYFLRRYSRLLSLLLWEKTISFPLGAIWPLAILGAIFALKKKSELEERRSAWFLAAFIAIYGAAVALFFVTSRYRLPVIPAALCFAAYAVIWFKDKVADRQWSSIKWSAPFLVAAALFCNLPHFRIDLYMPGENEFMLGRVFYDKGNYSIARTYYLEALKQSPNNAVAINDLGNIALFEDKPTEALDRYDQALKLDSFYAEAQSNRGVALVKLGRYAEAAEAFRKAIELAPDWDVPQKGLQNIVPYLKKAED